MGLPLRVLEGERIRECERPKSGLRAKDMLGKIHKFGPKVKDSGDW